MVVHFIVDLFICWNISIMVLIELVVVTISMNLGTK